MIQVSLTLLVFVYLGLFLAVVFANWIAWNIRRQRAERHSFRHRLRCGLCALEFEDAGHDPLPRCPRCGSLNERDRFRRL